MNCLESISRDWKNSRHNSQLQEYYSQGKKWIVKANQSWDPRNSLLSTDKFIRTVTDWTNFIDWRVDLSRNDIIQNKNGYIYKLKIDSEAVKKKVLVRSLNYEKWDD
jgi:hypothetical protein